MRLFQYWDTGDPPDEVAQWIDGFRRMNPDLDHQLFDRDRAGWFIGKYLGRRERQAFEACAVPSMQSDCFRMCALLAKGGVYLDADIMPMRPLRDLLALVPGGLVMAYEGYLNTAVMVFQRPGNPFVRASLELMVDNIFTQRFEHVLVATGPPVSDAVMALLDEGWLRRTFEAADEFARGMRFGALLEAARRVVQVTPELEAAFRAIRIQDAMELGPWIRVIRAAYKSTERDWRNWQGSIYTTAAAAPQDPPPSRPAPAGR